MSSVDFVVGPDLPEHLSWQVVACMRELWPSLFSGNLEWMTEPYPSSAHPHHFVAHRDGVMVSYASVLALTVESGGRPLKVAALGNVLTSRPYRGRGFSGRILDEVSAWTRQQQFDVACLFCDATLRPFYARRGWIHCPGGTLVGEPHLSRVHPECRMMLFLSPRGNSKREALVDDPLRVAHPW